MLNFFFVFFQFLGSSFNSEVTDFLDVLDCTSLISSAEYLDSLSSWQGNVIDAGHTPYGSDTSEDEVIPASLEPGMDEVADAELLKEAAARTRTVGSSQDFNEKTLQWIWERNLWPGKFATFSPNDEVHIT